MPHVAGSIIELYQVYGSHSLYYTLPTFGKYAHTLLNSLYFRERIGYAYTINLGATSMPSVPPFTKKDAQSAAKAGVDKSAIVKALRTPRPPVQESGCSQPKK